MNDDRITGGAPESPDGLLDHHAGEYALGTLSNDEIEAAEQRMAGDPAFARDVAMWQQRLSPLLDAIPQAEPPMGVFYDVRRAIGSVSHDAISEPEFSTESLNVIRFDAAERSMRRWRRLAVLSGTVAAGLAAFIVFREFPELQATVQVFLERLQSFWREN